MNAIRKCNSAFIETDVDDEVVIVSLEDGQFFSLKETGHSIWKKIDGARDRNAILQELEAEFDAASEVLARDLDAFLAQVSAAGFIEGNGRN
ncbi:PqqD family protein [Parerythrobacter jejuensis]|uniref:PqqD family peptide modification chaperone n=1 Tax=Parerythrobacter jejuensis TaxID=795812 RepID=A0A845AQ59_9SPHN|nr:PqqD family protein [Parerythrobacter jejuensis]MXP31035.1 PqqD family peptide modification chaperone [Parerythrobacter jejuensis]MXP33795.1 PqqD family peptide modification chaperone [Parerythrobacter jejuensis]